MMEREKANWLNRSLPRGNHRCGHCSFWDQMQKGMSLVIGGETYIVHELITGHSRFAVYVIFCLCKWFYIGKTNRPLFTRFREHRQCIVTGKRCPRLIKNICENHDSDTKVLSFAGIQKVPYKVSDKHVKLLQMETRCIIQCNALEPLGLNDFTSFL